MDKDKVIRYLCWIGFYLAITLLIYFWFEISNYEALSVGWLELVKSLVPNILSPLIIFGILYILFFRKGIDIEKIIRGSSPQWFKTAYENYNDIDWSPYLKDSRKLVIVAFFFEEWINNNSAKFNSFLAREDSNLVVYLPNYKNTDLLTKIHQLIPEHSPEVLSNKIQDSIDEIKKRSVDRTQNVHVSLYDKPFNYTYQLFDKIMFLSFNVLSRERDYNSPFIVFDLVFSKALNKFFDHETASLEHSSEKLNLNQWTKS